MTENTFPGRPVRVSILVCTRNRPEFIPPCIQSLQKQSYPHREIIVVDQSTNDKTEKITFDSKSFKLASEDANRSFLNSKFFVYRLESTM